MSARVGQNDGLERKGRGWNAPVPWGQWRSLNQALKNNPNDPELLLQVKARRTFGVLRQRCLNPKNPKYPNYGGRGIKVLVTLEDFVPWYCNKVRDWTHANSRTVPTVDRLDNNGHYELSNMRVVTRSENSKKLHKDCPERMREVLEISNATCRIPVQVEGKMFGSLREAADYFGVNPGAIVSSAEKYMGKVSRDKNKLRPSRKLGFKVTVLGKEYRSLRDAARQLGKTMMWVIPRVEKQVGERGNSQYAKLCSERKARRELRKAK